jgi:hypothetical protein
MANSNERDKPSPWYLEEVQVMNIINPRSCGKFEGDPELLEAFAKHMEEQDGKVKLVDTGSTGTKETP